MKITVALLPRLLRDPASHVVGVVDVLRASTSLVVMFDRGLQHAVVTSTEKDARSRAAARKALLCGEVRSVPPEGFDHGNSPVEYASLRLKGKQAVLMTTNGTRALTSAARAPAVVVATLVNRRAATERMLAEATRRRIDVAVLCAGREHGAAFSLEDTAVAGAIVETARELDPALHLTDEAWAAYHLWRFYRGDAMRAFRESAHGRSLLELGFEHDLRFAAQADVYDGVPVLHDEDGLHVLRAGRRRAVRKA
jgi:2-phosphosulfolactate phosphatase